MAIQQWNTRTLAILFAIADRNAQGKRPDLDELTATTGLDRDLVAIDIRTLIDDRYLTAVDAGSLVGDDWLEIGLTSTGRQLAGQWPTAPQSDQQPLSPDIGEHILVTLREIADSLADDKDRENVGRAVGVLSSIGGSFLSTALYEAARRAGLVL